MRYPSPHRRVRSACLRALLAVAAIAGSGQPLSGQVLGRLDKLRDLSQEGCNKEPPPGGPVLEYSTEGSSTWAPVTDSTPIRVRQSLRLTRPIDASISLERAGLDGRLVLAPAVVSRCQPNLNAYPAWSAPVAHYAVAAATTGSANDLEVQVTSGWLYGRLTQGRLWIVTPHARFPLRPSSTTEVVVAVSPQGDSTMVFVKSGTVVINGDTIRQNQLKRLPSTVPAAGDPEIQWSKTIDYHFDDIWRGWWGRKGWWVTPSAVAVATAVVCSTSIDCPWVGGNGKPGSVPLVLVIRF